MERITSRSNPLVAHLKKLAASGSYRRACGEYVCDSPKLLQEAVRWGAPICTVVTTDAVTLPALGKEVRVVEVPQDVMSAVSPAKTPQGVVFTCRLPEVALPAALPERIIVLDAVQDPGNVGTVWRTADAFGCGALVLLPGCADPFGPKTVRSSMGAVFRTPVYMGDAAVLQKKLREEQMPLYGAALREDTRDVRELDFRRAAIAIGSEGRGLSQEMLQLCDATVKIPMEPTCESLNAAIAATVLLWEAYR